MDSFNGNESYEMDQLVLEASETMGQESSETIKRNNNIVNSMTTSIISHAKSLEQYGPMLSVNSILGTDIEVASHIVKLINDANDSLAKATIECAKLKENLEREKTNLLVSYESEVLALNNEKAELIRLTNDKIGEKIKAAKRALLLSSAEACNMLLNPKRLRIGQFEYDQRAPNLSSNNQYNHYSQVPLPKDDLETDSVASSGFFEDEAPPNSYRKQIDFRQSSIPAPLMRNSNSTSNFSSNRNPNADFGQNRRILQLNASTSRLQPSGLKTDTIQKKIMIPTSKLRLSRNTQVCPPSSLNFDNSLSSMRTPKKESLEPEMHDVPEDGLSSEDFINPFGTDSIETLDILCLLETPDLSSSLAATFLLNKFASIGPNSNIAITINRACFYKYRNFRIMYETIASELKLDKETFIDFDIIQFPKGREIIDVLITKFSDELRDMGKSNPKPIVNNAIIFLNIFVHLTKYGRNRYYRNFLVNLKEEDS